MDVRVSRNNFLGVLKMLEMSRIWKGQFFVSTFRGVRRVQFFMGTPNRFFTNSREIVIGRIQKLDFCAIVLGYTHCCYHLHSAPKDRISHNMFLSTFCTQTADIGYIKMILWGRVSLCLGVRLDNLLPAVKEQNLGRETDFNSNLGRKPSKSPKTLPIIFTMFHF